MPRQRTFLGRPLNIRLPPRRFQLLFALAVSVIFLVIYTLPSKITTPASTAVAKLSEEIQETAQHAAEVVPLPKIPQLWNPFGKNAHQPPDQSNSDDGETKWYSDLKYLNPFSSKITLDEERAVLPPLAPRTPIYTFYDTGKHKDTKVLDAQNDLLLTWRRAWYAQGFRPVVLGLPEAKKSPLYAKLQKMGTLAEDKKVELERWLAWSHMGGGILSNWLALPMATYNDPTLVGLRLGQFNKMTFQSGLITASKDNLSTVLLKLLDSPALSTSATIMDAIASQDHNKGKAATGVAFYDMTTLGSRYKAVTELLSTSQSDGLIALNNLITSHLHTMFLNDYSSGIAVLKPAPEHTTNLVSFATKLARILTSCPSDSPLPSSCPPNLPHCRPCSEKNPLPISYPTSLEEDNAVFTIGTVPHPLTFTSITSLQEPGNLTKAFVRRDTLRDAWLNLTTSTILGSKLGGPQRLRFFKEAVASPDGGIASRSLWLTAEGRDKMDLEWLLGFPLPRSTILDTQAMAKDPKGGEDSSATAATDHDSKSETDLTAIEKSILKACTVLLTAKANFKKGTASTEDGRRRELLESWNLADAEAWRFVKAFSARRAAERERWEKEESKYAGSEEGRGGRWLDIL